MTKIQLFYRIITLTVALSLLFIILITNAQSPPPTVERFYKPGVNRRYTYLNYGQTVNEIQRLNRDYPALIELNNAQDNYGVASPGSCGNAPCKQYYIRVTEERTLTPERPEVFFSGCLHGNERVGPTTVVELARLLVENYYFGNNEWLKRMVQTRSIYIMPSANALGYYKNTREENGIDPNRDFPYDTPASRCMKTTAARAVNELWREHLFQLAITFHGGMRAISYEWGSNNHGGSSKDISPDDIGFETICQAMGKYGGKNIGSNSQYYPVGILDATVYPVGGGMEDWAYAASFDSTNSHPCVPGDQPFGSYPTSKTRYDSNMLRTLNVLVETADAKTPNSNTLGHLQGLFESGTSNDGHIARNIRLCLLMTDVVQPYVLWHNMHQIETDEPSIGSNLTFGWDVGGGFSVTKTYLRAIKIEDNDSCPHELSTRQKFAIISHPAKVFDTTYDLAFSLGGAPQAPYKTFWSESEMPRSNVILGSLGSPYKQRFSSIVKHDMLPVGNYLFAAIAIVDSAWEHKRPTSSPNVDPISHVVRARTKENYMAENGQIKIVGGKEWFSRPRCYKITPNKMVHHKTEKKPDANPTPNAKKKTTEDNKKQKEDNITHVLGNITDAIHQLEDGSWRKESLEVMKKALADTLVAIVVILVLATICACTCRCMYYKYYYAKHTEEEVETLTSKRGERDIELVGNFKDNPMSDGKPAAWGNIDDDGIHNDMEMI